MFYGADEKVCFVLVFEEVKASIHTVSSKAWRAC